MSIIHINKLIFKRNIWGCRNGAIFAYTFLILYLFTHDLINSFTILYQNSDRPIPGRERCQASMHIPLFCSTSMANGL